MTVLFKDWETKGNAKVQRGLRSMSINGTQFKIESLMYSKRLDELASTLNYFTEIYDPEQELLTNLVNAKREFGIRSDINPPSFGKYIASNVLTDSVKEKLYKLIDDNYDKTFGGLVELKPSVPVAFDPKHLLISAWAMRLIIPIVQHYRSELPKGSCADGVKEHDIQLMIFDLYEPSLCSVKHGYEVLYTTFRLVEIKTSTEAANNKLVWERNNYNHTEVAMSLFKVNIICNTLFKFNFNNNPIAFMYIGIDKHLQYCTTALCPNSSLK